MRILVGTAEGLYEIGDGVSAVAGGERVTALTRAGDGAWLALVGDSLWRSGDGAAEWRPVQARVSPSGRAARAPDPWTPTCLAAHGEAVLVGTAEAHLLRVIDGAAEPVEGFEVAEGRDAWYTPWGGPPDVRSISVAGDDVYVNVHVGGILRSLDGEDRWRPTIDIDADVHQVLAVDGSRRLLAPGAYGLSVSDDAGDTWRLETDGLHAGYLRAVAVAGDQVLVSASTGPGGGQAAVYRRPVAGGRFERCRSGLPEWFPGNVDTGCLAAVGGAAVLGSSDGTVYVSRDAGRSWTEAGAGLPPITCVGLDGQ